MNFEGKTMLLDYILTERNNKRIQREWRSQNPHNMTTIALNGFNHGEIIVGKNTYGRLDVYNDTKSKLEIGNYCSIADGVKFLVGMEHHVNSISTYPFKALIMGEKTEALSKGNIVIDDDVWIGNGALILSGVHIGQGAVIAAGAVVSKDIPPYAIAGGVPAKIIKYRFREELIKELLKINYSELTEEMIKEHIEDLYASLENKEQIQWMLQNK